LVTQTLVRYLWLQALLTIQMVAANSLAQSHLFLPELHTDVQQNLLESLDHMLVSLATHKRILA